MNPNLHLLYLASGFVTGKVYHVINTTTGARVIGLGLLTARDIVAFLRNSTAQQGNPCAGTIERAYAFGASQSGRYLRQFLYLGLNEDEQERMVFDGLLVHIAGGKRGGDFNQLFGQPGALRSCAGTGGGGVFSCEHYGQALVRHPDEGVHLAKFLWQTCSRNRPHRCCRRPHR